MGRTRKSEIDRRRLVLGVSAFLTTPTILRAQEAEPVLRNISSFALHDWKDHFDNLGKGILLSDMTTKVLQHWTSDGEMRVYPTSVPLTDELTKRGYTEVVEKRKNPSWAPTPSMRERNPEWPAIIKGGDPSNPLGTRALYLSWQYYRIHGTQDTRKIGRRSSNGCIGLFNEQIEEVYERTPVGTQVKLI
ncbi:L,D-transpeptidase (plasmid) [Aliiroseovarius crassostreae]|uniref:L,D-transpeptidase n=1 Tax=Aliiroseovarius crassostreae TaxID=154981 RepID=UPI0021F9FD4D|nr:L,D-transpeptidase [Aliiroseovarius crassostreae]UWP93905.1 L,D-transpeptidase [Aliiroseovarius crassostreae]UWQ00238.1 L,D-transpeptidase [Aliiroseovarius crassostreae]